MELLLFLMLLIELMNESEPQTVFFNLLELMAGLEHVTGMVIIIASSPIYLILLDAYIP